MKKNIILIGYMGSGKSAVGKKIADFNSVDYVDLDNYIEEKEQKTIANIFEDRGEIYFRKIEALYLKELISNKSNSIIALGGGTPCFGNNMSIINSVKNGVSIYLQTSIKELSNRLYYERTKRPLIAHTKTKDELSEFIAKHLFERTPYYNQANYAVKTDAKSVSEISTEIISLISV